MSYTITSSDGSTSFVVQDRMIQGPLELNAPSNCSINLVGRGAVAYGEATATNAVWMLEHFANATPPQQPLPGQLWYNTTIGNASLQLYNTSDHWVQVASADAPIYAGNLDLYNAQAPAGSRRYRIENDLTTNLGKLLISKIDDAGGAAPTHLFTAITINPTDGATALIGNSTATTPAADDNSAKIATTGYVIGQAANAPPLMDNTTAVTGASTRWARADHVHPTDSHLSSLLGSVVTVPVGGIIMWSGSSAAAASIPNWHICDGTNGTPDLRERFIIGAGSNPVNATGGTASTTLSLANLPSHSHTIAPHGHGVSDAGHTHSVTDPVHNHTLSDPTHTHTVGDPGHDHHVADPGHAHWFPVCSDGGSGASAGGRSGAAAPNEATLVAGTGVTVSASASGISLGYGATNITLGGARTGVGIGASATNIGVVDSATLTTSAVGTASGTAVSNLPPYYALIFIMRIS